MFPCEKDHPEMSPLPPTCSLEIYMHLTSNKVDFFFPCKEKIIVENTVGGIVDSSHVS